MESQAWDAPTVERRLTIATEAARIGLWDWNLVTGEMVYSRLAKLICGFDPIAPVTLDMVRAVIHPDDLAHTWAMSRRAMDPLFREHEPYRYRIVRADTGRTRWVLAYGQATFAGEPGCERCIAYTGTVQDITEQKERDDLRLESAARLKLALEVSEMAVWEVHVPSGTVTHSPRLNALCGFPPDARPTLSDIEARYAPGELERLRKLAEEATARGDGRFEVELRLIWPDGTPKWLRLSAQDAPGDRGRVIGVLNDITARKNAEERTELISRELRHRIKNSLAIVQTIAVQSIRAHPEREAGIAALNGRLVALSEAASAVTEDDWQNTSLIALAERIVAPHHDGARAERFEFAGLDMPLPAKFASALALALHELATNAGKYGALSVPGGRVVLAWTLAAGGRFELTWTEIGGPPVSPPERAGFGTRLIERALFGPFDGHASLTYAPDGLHCRIVASIPT